MRLPGNAGRTDPRVLACIRYSAGARLCEPAYGFLGAPYGSASDPLPATAIRPHLLARTGVIAANRLSLMRIGAIRAPASSCLGSSL